MISVKITGTGHGDQAVTHHICSPQNKQKWLPCCVEKRTGVPELLWPLARLKSCTLQHRYNFFLVEGVGGGGHSPLRARAPNSRCL